MEFYRAYTIIVVSILIFLASKAAVSQSILDECVNDTVILNETCTLHPAQKKALYQLFDFINKDISVVELDINIRLQEGFITRTFDLLMSDFGKRMLEIKSELEFFTEGLPMLGSNMTKRSMNMVASEVGCVSNFTTSILQKRLRNWLICEFIKTDKNGMLYLSIKAVCLQKKKLNSNAWELYPDKYTFECCSDTDVEQTCKLLNKGLVFRVTSVFNFGISALGFLCCVAYFIMVKLQTKEVTFDKLIYIGKNTDKISMSEFGISTRKSDLVTYRTFSLLNIYIMYTTLKSVSDAAARAHLTGLCVFCHLGIFLGIVLQSISNTFPLMSTVDLLILFVFFFLGYAYPVYHILLVFFKPCCIRIDCFKRCVCSCINCFKRCPCKGIVDRCIKVKIFFGKVIFCVNSVIIMYILQWLYIFFVCSSRFFCIVILGLSYDTPVNKYQMAAATTFFIIVHLYESVKTLSHTYTKYLRLCMKIIAKCILKNDKNVTGIQCNVVRFYSYESDNEPYSESDLSNTPICEINKGLPLFYLSNGEPAMSLKFFLNLCEKNIFPSPGHFHKKAFHTLLKFIGWSVFVFAVFLGMYNLGKVYQFTSFQQLLFTMGGGMLPYILSYLLQSHEDKDVDWIRLNALHTIEDVSRKYREAFNTYKTEENKESTKDSHLECCKNCRSYNGREEEVEPFYQINHAYN